MPYKTEIVGEVVSVEEEEEYSLLDEEERYFEDGLPKQTSRLLRAGCWGVCSFTTLYTIKQLLTTQSYHYPLTLAFHSFLAILVAYGFAIYNRLEPTIGWDGKALEEQMMSSWPEDLQLNKAWWIMLPAALTAGASLPMLYSGLLHMPSLAVIIMLFPIAYAAETMVLFVCCSLPRSEKLPPWETFIGVIASSIVLFNEYRLMVPGLIWGVTSILVIGVARAFFTIGSERSGSHFAVQAKLTSAHGFVVMSIIFGLIFSGGAAYVFEDLTHVYSISCKTLVLLCISLVALVGAAFTGTTVLVYSPIQGGRPAFTNMPISALDYLTTSASGLMVILAVINTGPSPVVAWLQLFAYQTASVLLIGASQVHAHVLSGVETTKEQVSKFLNLPVPEGRKPNKICTSTALIAVIMAFSWSLSILSTLSVNSIPPSLAPTLDFAYKPTSRFDIVVSMYDEDPASVKRMLDSISKTNPLSTITPNIIIYTKDSSADLEALKDATGATNVTLLPNLGREGGTYLHHMVHNWDTLAEQTLFIQAHAHNARELLPRINSYLVPETGMLSLGFTGITCDCETCEDRHGWKDTFNLMPSLYSQIYPGQKCENTPLLLSYKGQFIASARRIRGVKKMVYEDMLRAITSTDGWSHAKDKVVGEMSEVDTPDNPFFGFTMERVWGLLMQCATDGGVAAKCPSLLSGMSRGGDVRDCQCVDEIEM